MFTRFHALHLAVWLNLVWGTGLALCAEYSARDTCRPEPDDDEQAQQLIDAIVWEPTGFTVTTAPAADEDYTELVQFPSPRPSGNARNDTVSMEWYQPTAVAEGVPIPAVLVVHESGSGMTAGRLFARSLREKGLNTFLIHLPYYGKRRGEGGRGDIADFLSTMRQGIADVRRARDAVAVLPGVDGDRISLQGTSLGGFVSALAGGLDGGFNRVFLMLAGGDLSSMLENGQRDTAKLRDRLAEAGIEGEALRELLWNAEPLRLAHRLDPETTWLYSAMDDDVVPPDNARQLAAAIGLEAAHHPQLPGDHYTVILFFTVIVDHVVGELVGEAGARSVPDPHATLRRSRTRFDSWRER